MFFREIVIVKVYLYYKLLLFKWKNEVYDDVIVIEFYLKFN